MTDAFCFYGLEYISNNEYEEPVKEAIFEFLILPCNDHFQSLIDFKVFCEDKSEAHFSFNSYGFQTVRVRPSEGFTNFKLSLHSNVKRKITSIPTKDIKASFQEDTLSSPHFFIENFLFLQQTLLTKIEPGFLSDFPIYQKGEGVLNFLQILNNYVYSFIKYQTDVTNVHSDVNEVIQKKRGVCQDYSHLFIALARHNKIPCRYVSGYLNQGSTYIGSAMLHAWVEALIPGIGWLGYDPTNNIFVDEHYVKICHGRDYSDCAPIKGILLTNGENRTHHQVKVAQQ